MKIAFLNIYNGVIDRGAETFIKEIASHLSKSHDVTVFQSGTPNGKEEYKVGLIPVNWNWTNKSGVGTIRARFFIDYWSRQVAYFTLKTFPQIFKEKFDIVVPVNGGWQPAFIRLITWLYGGKMIISGQSGIGWDDRNNLWCFPNTFVALSTSAKKWATGANPLVKVDYIPNGVDTKKFTQKGVALQILLEKPIVLCVGALTPTKRIDLVIKAVARLKKVSLLIVGDGDLKNELQNLGTRLLGGRFKILKLPFEKMPEIYRSADVFTIPSESYYSFEIVLIEAMATNLPVVANDDSIRKEIVGDAGILVDPTDTEAYATALETALKKEWRDQPRKQAEKFDWDDIADKYAALFEGFK